MNKEKQIEEMARSSCSIYDKNNTTTPCGGEMLCDFNCTQYNTCKVLYENGYRKASDVARELFEEIEEVIGIRLIDDDILRYEQDLSVNYKALAKLKKKYESEGAECQEEQK